MQLLKNRFWVLALLMLVNSCNYYNTDEYFVEHLPSPVPELSIHTSFDTLPYPVVVVDSILFEYKVTLDTGRVYFTYLEFQGAEGFVYDTNAARVWLKPDPLLLESTYDLNMTIAYKTTSGSLADLIDAEYAFQDTSWTLQVKEEIE